MVIYSGLLFLVIINLLIIVKRIRKSKNQICRREFIGSAAAFATIAVISSGLLGCNSASVNGSRFGGIQVGGISYSFRSMPSSAENILGYRLDCGLTSVKGMAY